MNTLKFYWNGIRVKSEHSLGPLQLCSYSKGALKHHPEGTITIYGKCYRPFSSTVQSTFLVQDETDILTDYIVNEHIRVLPTHPLYAEVLNACEAQEAHYAKRQAKRLQQVPA